MAEEQDNMVQCAGCGADYDASDPAEAQLHASHNDVRIEQA